MTCTVKVKITKLSLLYILMKFTFVFLLMSLCTETSHHLQVSPQKNSRHTVHAPHNTDILHEIWLTPMPLSA